MNVKNSSRFKVQGSMLDHGTGTAGLGVKPGWQVFAFPALRQSDAINDDRHPDLTLNFEL